MNHAPTLKVHKFEQANLGLAPYVFLGVSREIYQAIPGDSSCPIQPGTCCDYCGTGIILTFHLRSSDGKRFKVGSDCIGKSGDEGLKRIVSAEESKRRREKSEVAYKAAHIELQNLIMQNGVELKRFPHPNKQMNERGKTFYDYAVYVQTFGGLSGRAAVIKTIKARVKP